MPKTSPSFLGRLLNLLEAGIVVSIGGLVFGWLGRFHFLPDLATHFRIQAICALLFCGSVLFLFRRRRWGVIGVGVGLLALSTLWPYFATTTLPVGDNRITLRLLSMNVLTSNMQKDDVVRYIKKMSPDVFILLEVDAAWSQAIQDSLSNDWPYQLHEPRHDNFGILLCSKRKPSLSKVFYVGKEQLPSVETTVERPGGEAVRIVGTHPLPPMGDRNWSSRNEQMRAIADTVGEHPLRRRTLLAGDLNCSPWSPFFSEWQQRSGLRDSGLGFGLPPTWYAANSFLTALPIDHVLVGSEIAVKNRVVGPDLGSDHRAVVVDFGVTSTD